MKRPFVEQYKGYTLTCRPQETHDNGFLAFVIITHGAEPVQVDRAAVLDLQRFELEGEAALAALGEAIRWVDDAESRVAGRRPVDRRSRFSDRRKVPLSEQPRPIDLVREAAKRHQALRA